jgi:hypothetical protein
MNLYRKLIIITALLMCLQVINVNAEPSKKTRYLINEPVSMLDFGIYRLNKRISSYKNSLEINGKLTSAIWSYNYNDDRLNLHISYHLEKENKEKIKQKIKQTVKYIKNVIYPSHIKSYISHYFMHEGYTSKNKPDNLYEHIDNIAYINIRAMFKYKTYHCISPMNEAKFLWVDKE